MKYVIEPKNARNFSVTGWLRRLFGAQSSSDLSRKLLFGSPSLSSKRSALRKKRLRLEWHLRGFCLRSTYTSTEWDIWTHENKDSCPISFVCLIWSRLRVCNMYERSTFLTPHYRKSPHTLVQRYQKIQHVQCTSAFCSFKLWCSSAFCKADACSKTRQCQCGLELLALWTM